MKWLTSKDTKEELHVGIVYMLISSVMLSFFTLFSKFAIENTSYFLLTFLRFSVPFLFLLPFLLWKTSIKSLFYTNNLRVQFLRISCVLLYQYSIFYYLMHATLLDVTVLQNTAPLFIPILGRIFFKQSFKLREVISIAVSFVGVLCILQPEKALFGRLSIVGLLAPLGQAGSQVLYGHQARRESQSVNLFYLYFLCSLVSGVIFLFSEELLTLKYPFEKYSLWTWVNIVVLGVTSIFNQSLRGRAYQHGSASALAPFLYFSLIFSAILDWYFFNQLPNWLSFLGAIFVIMGGLIQMYKKKKPV